MPDSISFDGLNVWNVPPELAAQYHGCGYALIAIKDDKIKAIVYLSDIDESFYFDDEILDELNLTEQEMLEQIINDLKVGQVSKHLETIGSVHIGMMSSYEFVEL